MRQYIGKRQVTLKSELMTHQPVKRGAQHAPLAHSDFYRAVQGQIKGLQLSSSATIHSVTPNGERYFGLTMLEHEHDYFAPVLGWCSTHNQRSAIMLYMGAGFFEPDCLCLSDRLALPTRQTKLFAEKLPGLLQASLSHLVKESRQQVKMFKSFKRTNITESTAEHAIVDMIRQGVINVKRVEHVIDRWDTPVDPALHKQRTVWRLFCAVADSYKPVTSTDAISTLVDRSPKLMNYCRELALVDL